MEALNDNKFHEAGYDAYTTGFAFAKMFYALDEVENEKVTNALGLMRSRSYFKNGLIDAEEPTYSNVIHNSNYTLAQIK